MRSEKVNPAWNRTGTTINANTVARARADQQNHSQGGLQPDRRGNRQQRTLPTPDMRQSSAPPPMQSGRRETTGPGYGNGGGIITDDSGGVIDSEGAGGFDPSVFGGTDTGMMPGVPNEPGGGIGPTEIIRGGPGAGMSLDSPEAQWAKQFHAQYGAWPPGFDWIAAAENDLQPQLIRN